MPACRGVFALCAVAILYPLAVSQPASLTCTDLLRPLDHLDSQHMGGRWALVAGSFNDPAHLQFFKLRDSSSIYFSKTNRTSNISYTPSVHFGGKCHYRSYNVTLEGSTLIFDVQDRVNLTLTFIYTSCSDCLVMRFDNKSKTAERLWLFSRRRKVEVKELEEFTAQVECLNMLPPAVMDPTKELCQEEGVYTEEHQES